MNAVLEKVADAVLPSRRRAAQERDADKATLARKPALEAQCREIGERIASVKVRIAAGELTPAALSTLEHQHAAAARQLAEAGRAENRLRDSCPDARLQAEAARLRGRKKPVSLGIEQKSADLAARRALESGILAANQRRAESRSVGYLTACQQQQLADEAERGQRDLDAVREDISSAEAELAALRAEAEANRVALESVYAAMIAV